MATKQRKQAATLGAALAGTTTPAAPVQAAAPTTTTLYVVGKVYRVKANTKHAHDQHWAAIAQAITAQGPQPLPALAALGQAVHPTNAVPYVRYCVRRGWLVPAAQ
jgi:hypothetical protein